MELRHLKSFVVLAEELNFTRAANRMHMAQPPFSQRIRQLETEMGVSLFKRHSRQVRLTPAGQAFFDEVGPLLSKLESAIEACQQIERGTKGLLRVGFTGRASQTLLPLVTRVCGRSFPEVTLDIQGPYPTGELQLRLLNGELDIALCFLPLSHPDIDVRVHATCPLGLVLPKNHRLASSISVHLEELSVDPFVGYPANRGFLLRTAMDTACKQAGFIPRVIRETDSSQVLMSLVTAGVGITLAPRELERQEESRDLVFKDLNREGTSLDHGLAWRSNNSNPLLRKFLEIDLVEAETR
jgi:DNA-binding transcriptional LysR family regulator